MSIQTVKQFHDSSIQAAIVHLEGISSRQTTLEREIEKLLSKYNKGIFLFVNDQTSVGAFRRQTEQTQTFCNDLKSTIKSLRKEQLQSPPLQQLKRNYQRLVKDLKGNKGLEERVNDFFQGFADDDERIVNLSGFIEKVKESMRLTPIVYGMSLLEDHDNGMLARTHYDIELFAQESDAMEICNDIRSMALKCLSYMVTNGFKDLRIEEKIRINIRIKSEVINLYDNCYKEQKLPADEMVDKMNKLFYTFLKISLLNYPFSNSF